MHGPNYEYRETPMNHIKELEKKNRRNRIVIVAMVVAVLVVSVACLFVCGFVQYVFR